MRNASAKRRVKSNHLQINIIPKSTTSSLILEILKILIQNHVTTGEFTLNPVGEKTRSIASLQGAKKPDELDDLMLGSIVSQIGKCICIMFVGANAIRPYEHDT